MKRFRKRLIWNYHFNRRNKLSICALRRTGLSDSLIVSFKSIPLLSLLKPKQFNCIYKQCIYCPQSDDGRMCLTKHCAYFIQCNLCSSSYIGETKRTIRSRLREHLYSKKPPSFIDISLDTTCRIT